MGGGYSIARDNIAVVRTGEWLGAGGLKGGGGLGGGGGTRETSSHKSTINSI